MQNCCALDHPDQRDAGCGVRGAGCRVRGGGCWARGAWFGVRGEGCGVPGAGCGKHAVTQRRVLRNSSGRDHAQVLRVAGEGAREAHLPACLTSTLMGRVITARLGSGRSADGPPPSESRVDAALPLTSPRAVISFCPVSRFCPPVSPPQTPPGTDSASVQLRDS